MQLTGQTSGNLDAALAHTVSEITRTDTKASALLTLDGLLVAALGLLGTDVHGPALAVAVLGGLTLVAAVVLALLVIRPRLARPGGTTDRSGFIYWAAATPDTITAEMTEDRRPTRLQVLSHLCLRKMRMLRAAGDTSLAAVVLIAAALLLR